MRRVETLSLQLDERRSRLFVVSEMLPLDHGGVTPVAAATGVARSTTNRGLAKLGEEPGSLSGRGVRTGLVEALDAVDTMSLGRRFRIFADPARCGIWTQGIVARVP